MEILSRQDDRLHEEAYQEILQKEVHHDHEIVLVSSVIRWRANPRAVSILQNISLNDLCPLLYVLGYGKNSEVYRKLYRDMGYSLSGYWEIFYWKLNNEDADQYNPMSLSEIKEDALRLRWLLNGNGYFLEEEQLCGNTPCDEEDQAKCRVMIDNAMNAKPE